MPHIVFDKMILLAAVAGIGLVAGIFMWVQVVQ